MKKSSIEVTVEANGEVKIEAIGFKGGACEKATAAIEAALGTVAQRKKKPEYYQPATREDAAMARMRFEQ